MTTANALLTILVDKIKNDTLVLPTLPAIALKIRKAADDPNVNLSKMGDVIAKDPSLSARMIRIANSAYMGRRVKVTSVNQATTRIGLQQIKNIATALAMEQLFVSKNEIISLYIKREWENTTAVVANSMAVMQLYQQRVKKHDLSMDTMSLVGLVHNIGVLPILTEAERHKDVFANPTFLDIAIDKLSARLGTTIMQGWGFGREFAIVTAKWRDLSYHTKAISYLDFVRVGAALAGRLEDHKADILGQAIQRGVIDDMAYLSSDEFIEIREEAKQVFA